jgi:hypothetical protein
MQNGVQQTTIAFYISPMLVKTHGGIIFYLAGKIL